MPPNERRSARLTALTVPVTGTIAGMRCQLWRQQAHTNSRSFCPLASVMFRSERQRPARRAGRCGRPFLLSLHFLGATGALKIAVGAEDIAGSYGHHAFVFPVKSASKAIDDCCPIRSFAFRNPLIECLTNLLSIVMLNDEQFGFSPIGPPIYALRCSDNDPKQVCASTPFPSDAQFKPKIDLLRIVRLPLLPIFDIRAGNAPDFRLHGPVPYQLRTSRINHRDGTATIRI